MTENVKMEYMSINEASKLWGMDKSNIGKLARKGKISGAVIVARNWLIPKGTPRPVDGRTKKAKQKDSEPFFRFPIYVNSEEGDFVPPLSPEESMLRTAQKNFYSLNFDKAQQIFENLLKETKNIYIKIAVLFYLCSLSVEVYGGQNFKKYYYELQTALGKNFPYKKEVEIVTPWLYTVLAQFSSVSESLDIDFTYSYSKTAKPLLTYLSFYHIVIDLNRMASNTYSDAYELLCCQIEGSGAYYEACEAHFALFCAYYLTLNDEAMLYHLRKGMDIAKDHDLPLIPASYLFYYPDAFEKIAGEYPKEYIERIRYNSKIISKSFSEFTEKYGITKIFSCLSSKDYRYVLLAMNRCSNRQVAEIMKVSERTVTNRYANIFDKVGVNSKKELLEMLDYRFCDS